MIEQFNNIWINIMYNKWKILQDIYDTILVFNCIHYAAKTYQMWNIFISEINKHSKKGTHLVIRFLDRDLLETVLSEKTLMNNNDFVKRVQIPEKYIDEYVTDYWIKLYYSKIHIEPLVEPVISKNKLINDLTNSGWKIINTNFNNKELNFSWSSYENCFINCLFVKQI